MIWGIIGFLLGIGLFHFGARLGYKRGVIDGATYYKRFTEQLPWELKYEIKKEMRKYVSKKYKK